MDSEWVNVGSDDKPRVEHAHADGTRHKTDRTIPFRNDETPRVWTASYVCRECRDSHERKWPDE
jgi:hypothetical protein